jgi:hypothetical protein
MSYHEYVESRLIEAEGYPFYALLMAAMRQADTDNYRKFCDTWPEVAEELRERYNAPGGLLPGEGQQ